MEKEFGGRVSIARLAIGVLGIDWKVPTLFMTSESVQSENVTLLDLQGISAFHRLSDSPLPYLNL